MKKFILVLLVLPLVLVSCAKSDDDGNLQGLWVAKVKTSDLSMIKNLGPSGEVNKEILEESIYYKFDSGKLYTVKSKSYDLENNQIEKEVGSYKVSDGVILIDIQGHSCANVEEVPRTLKRKVPYRVSDDFSELTLNLGVGKKIVFKKLEATDADDEENSIENAVVGCFKPKTDTSSNRFQKSKVQKPAKEEQDLDLERKLRELQEQANTELNEDEAAEAAAATAE